jgi:hypothetical protein
MYAPLAIYKTYSHPPFLRLLAYSVSLHFTPNPYIDVKRF